MKKTLIMLFSVLLSVTTIAQEKEEKQIEELIKNFSHAADKNDRVALEECLDSNYRIVMNQLFGSDAVAVIDRMTYLDKIESKEWGGDTRTVKFNKITVNGNTANVHVIFAGKKATFISLMQLIKDKDGNWKLISDMPTMKAG